MPNKIDWNEKLSTGLLGLDEQHAALFQLFNEFIDAIEAGSPQAVLVERFEYIIGETLKHFAYEEQIMKNIGFPEYSAHKEHHEILRQDAELIFKDLQETKDGVEVSPSINFLRALIVKHMVEKDLKIRDYIKQGTL
ncbi:MAG: bacteriohemerythrin [Terasakiella sp.]|uniref:bacteriohemerythrin n=1 Tax=unclassified Terasakiella TaxID=2614952 RepID=UPI003B005354